MEKEIADDQDFKAIRIGRQESVVELRSIFKKSGLREQYRQLTEVERLTSADILSQTQANLKNMIEEIGWLKRVYSLLVDFKNGIDVPEVDFVSDFKQILSFLDKYELISTSIDLEFQKAVTDHGSKLKFNSDNDIDNIPKIYVKDSILATIINQGFSLKHLLECDENEIFLIAKYELK